jgi:vacuolar-type H+-ATPase subunit I/STV1
MKKILFSIATALMIFGCGNEPNPEIEKLKAERDSIARFAESKDSTINSFIESLNDIERNLGEVKQKQGIISNTAKEGAELQGSSKDRINEEINYINELMDENKKKLSSLQSKLKKSNVKIASLEKMIEQMTAQLQEKDVEIAGLKEQLAAMNIQITELSTVVTNLKEESAGKSQVIEQQTTKINTAWYAVGTYKELRDNRVVNKEGGFLGLGKKKILKTDFNQDYFTQIDVSKITTIPVNAKNAKIITNHPASAYKMNLDSKKLVKSITINNPEAFWRSSKYLVVTVEK